jgi:hypothetical protein
MLLEICAVLGFYAAYNGSFLPTFRDNLSVPIFKGQALQEDWTEILFRKVGNKLAIYAS